MIDARRVAPSVARPSRLALAAGLARVHWLLARESARRAATAFCAVAAFSVARLVKKVPLYRSGGRKMAEAAGIFSLPSPLIISRPSAPAPCPPRSWSIENSHSLARHVDVSMMSLSSSAPCAAPCSCRYASALATSVAIASIPLRHVRHIGASAAESAEPAEPTEPTEPRAASCRTLSARTRASGASHSSDSSPKRPNGCSATAAIRRTSPG